MGHWGTSKEDLPLVAHTSTQDGSSPFDNSSEESIYTVLAAHQPDDTVSHPIFS